MCCCPARATSTAGPQLSPVSGAQEEHDRAAVPGAGDVCRAEAHAGHGGRPHGGQRAAAAGRPVDRQGAAGDGADGLLDLRPGRNRQDVSGGVLRRFDRHSLRHAGQFPLQIRRRDGREPGAGPERDAQPGAGGGDHRRGGRGAGESAKRRGIPGPRAASSR